MIRDDAGAPVFYLSTGAWNVVPALQRFLRRRGLPRIDGTTFLIAMSAAWKPGPYRPPHVPARSFASVVNSGIKDSAVEQVPAIGSHGLWPKHWRESP